MNNPNSRFERFTVEYDAGEAPEEGIDLYDDQSKTILSENDSPDLGFRFSVNPYRGCGHGCSYCYARPSHEYLGFGAGTDFDTKIVVKTNAAELLREALARRSWKREWIAFSGVTDCYQPLEAAYGITRACLEVCRELRNPVGIVTKAALVRRDLELLLAIDRVASAHVYVSIPFADPELARAIEPSASSPAKRFETLRVLSQAGLRTGVAIAPLIPGLNESEVPRILEAARGAGATSAFTICLRLAAQVRPVFEERLRAALPGRAAKVLHALAEVRAPQGAAASDFGTRMLGGGPRWEAARQLFELHRRRLGFEPDSRPGEAPDPHARTLPRGAVQGRLFAE